MSRCYLVSGKTGQWEDVQQWFVCVSADCSKAYGIAEAAKKSADELENYFCGKCNDQYDYCNCEHKPKNEHDPRMRIDYGGVHYTVHEVEFV